MSLAPAAAAAALAVIVVSSLLLVSLAASRAGTLSSPAAAKPGDYPQWMAGPTRVLTGWLHASPRDERVLFTVLGASMLVGYLIVVLAARRLRPAWVIGTIVVLHLIFVLAPPLNLSDVFNYLNYGRMEVVHQLNPYTTIPALEPHGDPTFLLSNWHGQLSPYGPLFTIFTMALTPLGVAGSFWAMKVALMLASLASVFLVYRCAGLLGRNRLAAAAIVGMNPIVLLWGLGGDHNDFLMMFFIVLAFWLLLRAGAMRGARSAVPAAALEHGVTARLRRAWASLDGMSRPLAAGEPPAWMEVGAGIALVAAVAIKASSAVLIPVVLAGSARRMRVAAGLAIGAAAAAVMTVAAFGVNLPNVSGQDKLVVPDGLPNLLGLALGLGGATAPLRNALTVVLVAVIAGCCAWAWRTRRWITPSGWVTFALLLTLTWTLPWYIAWLLPLAALASSRRLRIAASVFGVYIFLAWMPYSSEILGVLHVNPATTNVGQQENAYMDSLLF